MSDDHTPRLGLPLIDARQPRHETLNEGLWRLEGLIHPCALSRTVTAQPEAPANGDAYILPDEATGEDWGDYLSGDYLIFLNGFWELLELPEGTIVYVVAEARHVKREADGWAEVWPVTELSNLEGVGINAAPDSTNRLSVSSPQVLFNNEGDHSRVYVNRAASGDDAAMVLQSGFSSRAILGLLGDDDFTLKTSADGSTFVTALTIQSATGNTLPGVDNALSLGASGRRWAEVWAVNGTIQTSDVRDKTNVTPLNPDAALSLIAQVDPVLFLWRDRGQGQAGQRLHAGFIAQHIHAGLEACGFDFGAWGLEDVNDPDSRQWIRPDQLVPVLWSALKRLEARLSRLEGAQPFKAETSQ